MRGESEHDVMSSCKYTKRFSSIGRHVTVITGELGFELLTAVSNNKFIMEF
jgi:hypothetical protein